MTLQTVADHVGVSRMTVSNAFSRPDQLSAALRGRILQAAADLGYVGPDPAARALARGTAGAVGILLTSSVREVFTDEVATSFVGAIAEQLAPTGLALTLLPSPSTPDVVPARDVAIDGALVYSCDPTSPGLDWLVRRGLPLVYVDQAPAPGIPSVNVDDRAGARAAAQHIVDLGHVRVAIVVSVVRDAPYGIVPEPTMTAHGHPSRQRLLGWHDALDAAGIRPVLVQLPHSFDDDGHRASVTLLEGPDRPTAVLCFSDAIAHGIVQAAGDLGIKVPEQLSVVGFDDNPLARRMRPALTTVRQDVAAKGRAAAAALMAALEAARAGVAGSQEHLLLPTELVVRDSTAKPPPPEIN
ncbi:MAG TPA: LacI family DNA-binding transcriptional regulator [Kineosporiaceae bacterium]|nr:LacI family DNA-binding transcriptional regulator [Kineosporiaceae bacterium]